MTSEPSVFYAREPGLSVAEFRRVLAESGLGATRPLDDEPRLAAMLAGAGLVMAARLDRHDGPLVGVARTITDFSWCAYMAELAVSPDAQGLGVGRGLIEATRRELGPTVSLNLTAMPDAVGFYDRIGMPRQADAYCFRRER